MDNIVINIEANTEGITSTIQLLEKLNLVDKKSAQEFLNTTQQYVAAQKQRQQAAQQTATAQSGGAVGAGGEVQQKTIQSYHSLGNAVNGAKGNILVLNGAMGLLGSKAEGLQTLVLKLHSSLLLLKGVKAFSNLEIGLTGATAAAKKFALALAANPIGLIAVAITSLAAAYAIFSIEEDKSAKAADRLNEQLEQTDRLISLLQDGYDSLNRSDVTAIELMKLRGDSRQKIHDKELQLSNDEIEQAQKLLDTVAGGAHTTEQYDKAYNNLQKAKDDQLILIGKFEKESTDIESKAAEDRAKKFDERVKDRLEALKKLQQLQIAAIGNKDDQQRAQAFFDFGVDLDYLDAKLIGLQKFNDGVIAAEQKLRNKLEEISRVDKLNPIDPSASKIPGQLKPRFADDSGLKDLEKKKDIELQIKKALYDGLLSLAEDFIAQDFEQQRNHQQELLDSQLSALDEKDKANEASRNNELISQRTFLAEQKKNADQRTKIEADGKKKLNDIKHKEDVANKLAKLFEIAIATARNIVEKPALALEYAALGAVMAGLVAAKPLPVYHKGRLAGGSSAEEHAIVRKDETITDPTKSRQYFPTLAAIHGNKVPAFALNSFVKNYSKSGSDFNYYKNASAMEWELRPQNKKVTNRLERIERAIIEGRLTASDLRRA